MKYDLGTKVYEIHRKFNWSSKKISMTDENGVAWYRYEAPRYTDTIREGTIVSVRLTQVVGDSVGYWDDEDVPTCEYVIEYTTGDIDRVVDDDLDGTNNTQFDALFLNREDADKFLREMMDADV